SFLSSTEQALKRSVQLANMALQVLVLKSHGMQQLETEPQQIGISCMGVDYHSCRRDKSSHYMPRYWFLFMISRGTSLGGGRFLYLFGHNSQLILSCIPGHCIFVRIPCEETEAFTMYVRRKYV
ncbi:hypothetical protein Pfo_025569, partial [Paulownia fortunei]